MLPSSNPRTREEVVPECTNNMPHGMCREGALFWTGGPRWSPETPSVPRPPPILPPELSLLPAPPPSSEELSPSSRGRRPSMTPPFPPKKARHCPPPESPPPQDAWGGHHTCSPFLHEDPDSPPGLGGQRGPAREEGRGRIRPHTINSLPPPQELCLHSLFP